MKTLIRDEQGESVLWWSWQDLRGEFKEGAERKAARRGWFCHYGRAWLHAPGNVFQLSWHFGSRRCSIGAGFSNRSFSEEAITLNMGIPFVGSFYFLIDRADWVKRLPGIGKGWEDGERELGISWSDGYLHLSLWCRPGHDWSRGDRWWHFKQPILWNPADFFLGRNKYSDRELETGTTEVTMPERTYPATYRLFESTWKRPRWPWPLRIVRGEIEVEGGIPIPGKGENSWDLDDDATYSLTCPATSPADLIEKMRASVLRRREKYGWNR